MTSFQLVNHQIKHMFGGIEAQKNSSLQYLQSEQRKLAKYMEKSQINHKKIYQSINTIKSSLMELSEDYLHLSKQSKLNGGLITKLLYQINSAFQDISDESLSLSKKMQAKLQNFVPNLKKIKQKYVDCAQTLQHYKKKVSLLKKGVDKQSLANIKQDEHQRFERNKDKLRNAEKQHDEALLLATKRFIQFNNEGIKNIYTDMISTLSNIGGNMMTANHKLMKYLCQNFSARQVLLAKQLKIHKKSGTSKVEAEKQPLDQQSLSSWMKEQNIQHRQIFFDHLVAQKQITTYLKNIVQREMNKINVTQKITEHFGKKSAIVNAGTDGITNFNQFKNSYNNHNLRHSHHSFLQQMKEEDPVQACEDLLQIQEPTQISQGLDQPSKIDPQSSPEVKKEENNKKVNNNQKQDNWNKNLQKFQKIVESNNINKGKISQMKSSQKIPPPKQNANEKSSIKILQTTKFQKNAIKTSSEFFNLNLFESKENGQKIVKPQQQLTKMHEHPFNFDIFDSVSIKSQTFKPSSNNSNNTNKTPKPHQDLFSTFDKIAVDLSHVQKKTPTTSQAIEQASNCIIFFNQFKPLSAQTVQSSKTAKPATKQSKFDDLLNL